MLHHLYVVTPHLGDNATATDDREGLVPVLDGVQEVGEIPGGLGNGNLRHGNPIIRYEV